MYDYVIKTIKMRSYSNTALPGDTKRFEINRTFIQGLPIKSETPTKLESRRRGLEPRVYVPVITRTSRLLTKSRFRNGE